MKKVAILCLAFVVILGALTAFAQDKADWAFYGSIRMWTAWEHADEETFLHQELSGNSKARGWNANGELQDDDQLEWTLQKNSRLGAIVKWGEIGGRAEFGNSGGVAGADFGATWRLLYGTWNFGKGRLLVGKDYTPYYFLISGLCGPGGAECNGIGFGSINGQRRSQLKLMMGGFDFALVEPASTTNAVDANAIVIRAAAPGVLPALTFNDLTPNDSDQTLPRIEAKYTFNLGPALFYVGGMYNTFKQEFSTAAGTREITIDGWAFGAAAKSSFGPLYVNASAQVGQNVNQAGNPTFLMVSRMLVDSTTFSEEDTEYYAAQGIVGYKLSESLTLEGGVVWQYGKVDNPAVPGQEIEQSSYIYYAQAAWSPAKNVFIVPEFGIVDNGDGEASGIDDVDLGKVTWFGIKWMIGF